MAVVNPKSVKVNVTTGTGMDIEWDDGHRTHFGFQWLRDACPCATCTEERNNHHRNPGEPAKQSTSLLPMYKEPAKPKEVKPVGRYALNIAWNDGHASGIYSWDYLREICQCEECRAKIRQLKFFLPESSSRALYRPHLPAVVPPDTGSGSRRTPQNGVATHFPSEMQYAE